MIATLWRSALRRGMRYGFDRGVLGGNPFWLVLGAAALLAHLAGRAMPRQPELIFVDDLEPGEELQITTGRRPR